MTPPKAPMCSVVVAGDAPLAGSSRLNIIKKRSDFLRAARAGHVPMAGFVLQYRDRGASGPLRVGFTCSKKVGNAVARNRAKRRLRAVAQQVLPMAGCPGTDYVLIGRFERTAAIPFETLVADLKKALERVK